MTIDSRTTPAPLVSIVVPTLSRPAPLTACLDAIAATITEPYEVLCVSSADDEPTQALLESRPGIRNIVQEKSEGFVGAANAGFCAARGEYVMQLNDDCILLPHSVDNALRFLRAPANRGIVGQAAFFHDTPLRRNIHQQIEVEGVRFVVCHVRGLCFANFGLTERALGEKLRWYDERFFMYGADPDFSLKIWDAGLRVEPCPGALVRHLELDDGGGAKRRAIQAQDNALLFAKWGMTIPAQASGDSPEKPS